MCVGGRGLTQQSQRTEGRALQLLDGRTGVATAFVRVVLASELSRLVLMLGNTTTLSQTHGSRGVFGCGARHAASNDYVVAKDTSK